MSELKVQYVKSADGVQIAYAVVGSGPAFVQAPNAWGDINLNSLPELKANREAIVAGGRQLVLCDGRGAGSSDRNVTDMSLAARLADLEAVVDKLALDQFALLGSIHGAPIAVAYAVRHPNRLSHLILTSPYARGADYYASDRPTHVPGPTGRGSSTKVSAPSGRSSCFRTGASSTTPSHA